MMPVPQHPSVQRTNWGPLPGAPVRGQRPNSWSCRAWSHMASLALMPAASALSVSGSKAVYSSLSPLTAGERGSGCGVLCDWPLGGATAVVE